jgi:glycosyltransferase involved in cell wall biosynthesis
VETAEVELPTSRRVDAGSETRLRILFLVYEFPGSLEEPAVSGEVKNPFNLARGLRAAGHHITIVSVPFLSRSIGAVRERRTSDFTVFDVPEGRSRSVARYLWRIANVRSFLIKHLRSEQYDVIHAHSPALAFAAVMATRQARIRTPVVTTAHGTYLPEVQGDSLQLTMRQRVRSASARLMLPVDRFAFRASTAVISVSRFQHAELEATYRIPADRQRMIYNGVDLALYRSDEPGRDRIAQGEGRPTILFVGRLVPKKGLQDLVAAFPAVADAVPDVRCIVVGGSALFDTFGDELRALAAALGLQDRFEWVRDVPEDQMFSYYRRAAVAVFPSINYESLPTVVLEAMACGIPVVATNAWGTPEALGSDHPGLVPQSDPSALARVIVSVLIRSDVARAAVDAQLARLPAFDLRRTVAIHETLYRQLIAVGQ